MSTKKRVSVDALGKAVARQLNARKAHQRLTQAQIESITGISQSQLSKQLRGFRAITIDEFESICTALDISMFEILEAAEREIQRDSKTTMAVEKPANELDARRAAKRVVVADVPAEEAEELSDDEIVAKINSGEFKVAAQKRTAPIEESFS
ncbi:helix-turn-helix transcriptional regulator [Corynebacterium sp. SCR221107]|uniref:helix-turn-helix domain-containing protein n=1 Tax=Corynebacterium sp. SCR221107 TaxID=3017361 RepID=UPI0022EC52F8|nr:helix-turn-helix transcriptional regulator [Corynebacterium sp. SCR221107]WBT08818.1 helix-turn-helix transcriptional regulator [Corynebacterium sp. SCR221107]